MSKRSTRQSYTYENQSNVEIRSINASNSLKIRLDDMKSISALTENQQRFFDLYNNGEEFIGLLGSAGSGKTFMALAKALEEVLDHGNPYHKITIVRSSVATRDVGFLPGTVEEKMAIFEMPYIQICDDLFSKKGAYGRLKEQDKIEFVPTSYVRGCTWDNSIVILDECENLTFHELSSVITRVGTNTKFLLVGDTKQNDLLKNKNDVSGLVNFLQIAKSMKEFKMVEFSIEDIVRSGLVKSWLKACDKLGY